jgi:dGTPase
MFDGNPQGFRQVALLSGKDEHGMNLTCSLLLATVKYPWRYRSMPQGAKKIGIFDAEWKHYEHACDRVGWTPTHKFPFLLLMEAADDIAYSMSDLEDGLEKKIIRIEDLADEFGEWRFASKSVHPMIAFKTSVINEAVESAAEAFTANAAGILAGNAVRLITLDSDIGRLMNKANEFARKQIYSHPRLKEWSWPGAM